MDTTIFLSRLIGPLFIVVALGLILNTQDYKAMLKEAMKSSFALYLSGFIAYLIGAIIILTHNTWGWNSDVIITLAGYAALIKGIFLLLSPKSLIRLTIPMVESLNCLKSVGVIALLLGAYLSYIGLFA